MQARSGIFHSSSISVVLTVPLVNHLALLLREMMHIIYIGFLRQCNVANYDAVLFSDLSMDDGHCQSSNSTKHRTTHKKLTKKGSHCDDNNSTGNVASYFYYFMYTLCRL